MDFIRTSTQVIRRATRSVVCVVEGTKRVVDSAGRSEKVTSGFDWIHSGTRETSNGTLFFPLARDWRWTKKAVVKGG